MAGMKTGYKLKAATVMESLVAMIILIICLGIATMIYSSILTGDQQRKRLHATLLANEEAMLVKETNNFLDNEHQKGDWIIKRTLEKYKDSGNLLMLSVSIMDADRKTIYTQRELIIAE